MRALHVVTGGSRGIGLALCAELLARQPAGIIVAASRKGSDALSALASAHPDRVHFAQCDVTQPESVAELGQRCASIAKSSGDGDTTLRLLVNTAGVLHTSPPPEAPAGGAAKPAKREGRMPERSLADIDAEWMRETLAVNAIGPVLVTQALRPMLGKGSVVANLSARVGSIGDNRLGGWWSYRMSKAALNMATRNTALELGRRGVTAVSLHPGTTATDLSAPFSRNVKPEKLFTPEFTARSLLDVVDGLGPEDNGGFFAYDGTPIEW